MFKHKRPRLHPRPEGKSPTDTLRLPPQPEESFVQPLTLKAPIRLDPRYVRSRLKRKANQWELENLLLFPLWELAILLLLPLWKLEVLLLFPLWEPSSSFPLGGQREVRTRSVYYQGLSAKFPLAFFPPVR